MLQAQFEVVGSSEYGRIFGINYDRTTEGKLYAKTLGNHILTSDNNGQTWSVLFAIEEGVFTSVQDNLKVFQENKLSYHIRSGSMPNGRSVYVLNLGTLEVENKYTPPTPDPNAQTNWVSSYSISEMNPNYALISVGYSIGISNYEKVYYTSDFGESWTEVYYTVDNFDVFTGQVMIHPENPEKLFITRGNGSLDVDGGLLISEDGGITWTEKITGIVLEPIAFHPNNSDEIWVGTGISFGAYPENIYKSIDGGENWEVIPIEWSDYLMNNINSIQFNPSNPSDIIILEDNEVAISNDGGQTWELFVYEGAADNPDSYYYGLNASFNPFNENEVFISANYYPFFSSDKGATMERVKMPYFISDGNVFYFDNATEQHLYYGVQFGFAHRNIQSGEENSYNILPINFVTNNSGTNVKIDRTQAGRVFVYFGGFIGYNLFLSDNHGETQVPLFSGYHNTLEDVKPVPNSSNKVWASFSFYEEDPEIYEIDFSNTNDIQITPINNPNSPGTVKELLFPNQNPQHIVAVKGSRVHETTDGGINWEQISEGLEVLNVNSDRIFKLVQNPLNAEQFSITSSKGIFTTINGGQSWEQISSTIVHNLVHSPFVEGHIIAITHSTIDSSFHLMYSKNEGETWELIENENDLYLPFATGDMYSSTDFHFYDDFVDIYIATSGLGVLKYTLDLMEMQLNEPKTVDNSFVIYPNPTNNWLNVISKEKIQYIEVYTMTGERLMSSNTKKLNVSLLKKGIYLVQVVMEDGRKETKKIIKN